MISYLSLAGAERFYFLAAILAVSLSGALILAVSSYINDLFGKEFMRGFEKIMAVIISFIAVQMIMDGIKAYFF
jgi:small neutral amino acid transporter SnatA (MarC family)